jgi:hypothetical protein
MTEAELRSNCPRCEATPLRIRWELAVKPIGSFSLAGQQMKWSAANRAVVWCTNCSFEVHGTVTGVEVVGDQVVAGEFISD